MVEGRRGPSRCKLVDQFCKHDARVNAIQVRDSGNHFSGKQSATFRDWMKVQGAHVSSHVTRTDWCSKTCVIAHDRGNVRSSACILLASLHLPEHQSTSG